MSSLLQAAALVVLLPVSAAAAFVLAVVTTQKRAAEERHRAACSCGGFHTHTGMVSEVNESLSPLSRFLYLFFNSSLGQYYWDHQIEKHRRKGEGPHTRTETVDCGDAFLVHPVAMVGDNYANLIVDKASGEVVRRGSKSADEAEEVRL